MSREFKLVLLGAGLLAAGSFLWPEDDPVKKAEESGGSGDGTGNSTSGGRTRTSRVFIVVPFTRPSTTSTVASTSSVRGGFGRSGVFSGG